MNLRTILRAATLCGLAMPAGAWAQAIARNDFPLGGQTFEGQTFEGQNGRAWGQAWQRPEPHDAGPFRELAGSEFFGPEFSGSDLRGNPDLASGRGRAARWTAHVAFAVTGQIALYASYATGFKARASNLARGSRPFSIDQAFLEAASLAGGNQGYGARFARPEDTKVYEIGMKAEWDRASFNLALFQQSIAGSQSSLPASLLGGNAFVLAQAGRETVRGGEVAISLRPARGWLASAAVTYLDSRYESYAASAAGDRSNLRPPGTPELSATLGAAREWPLAGGGRLILRGNYHVESPTLIQQALPGGLGASGATGQVAYGLAVQDYGTPALDSLLVASARGSSAIGGVAPVAAPVRAGVSELGASLIWALRRNFDVTLWGRNIANNRYQVSLLDADGSAYTAWGYANQPQSFGSTVRLRF